MKIDLSNLPPMCEWENFHDGMTQEECRIVEETSAHLATKYARLSAYLSRRQTGGKHTDAVERQNETARRVRQALGFTYADDKIVF